MPSWHPAHTILLLPTCTPTLSCVHTASLSMYAHLLIPFNLVAERDHSLGGIHSSTHTGMDCEKSHLKTLDNISSSDCNPAYMCSSHVLSSHVLYVQLTCLKFTCLAHRSPTQELTAAPAIYDGECRLSYMVYAG